MTFFHFLRYIHIWEFTEKHQIPRSLGPKSINWTIFIEYVYFLTKSANLVIFSLETCHFCDFLKT